MLLGKRRGEIEDKENLITKIQTLKNIAKGSCVQGKEKHLSYHNSRRSKRKKGADVIKYEGICQEDNNITDGSQKESVLLFN